MELGTTECLGVKEMGIDTLPNCYNQALRKPRSWRSVELWGEILCKADSSTEQSSRGTLGWEEGPERMGERPLAECHESPVLSPKVPQWAGKVSQTCTLVTSGHLQLPGSQMSRNKHGKQHKIQMLFCGSQNNRSDLTLTSWCGNIPQEQRMLCLLPCLQGPEYVKPAFLTNVGSFSQYHFLWGLFYC